MRYGVPYKGSKNGIAEWKAEEKLFIPKQQEEKYKKWKLSEGGFLFDV